jgi:phosphoglycerate dehydrogenase-like enzyme
MANVIITPHAGGSSPHEDERVAAVFLENLQRFVRKEPLQNVVDHDIGY